MVSKQRVPEGLRVNQPPLPSVAGSMRVQKDVQKAPVANNTSLQDQLPRELQEVEQEGLTTT